MTFYFQISLSFINNETLNSYFSEIDRYPLGNPQRIISLQNRRDMK